MTRDERLDELEAKRRNRLYFLAQWITEEDWNKVLNISAELLAIDAEIEGLTLED